MERPWLALSASDRALHESLAAIEHERWGHWQRYLHQQCLRQPDGSLVIPAGTVARWELQITTPYEQLSEQEKDSDREQVARYWPLLEAWRRLEG